MKYICHLEARACAVSHSAQEAARIAVAGGFAVDVWHDGRRVRVQPADTWTATVQRLAAARADLYASGGRPPRCTASGPGYRLAASARIPVVEAADSPPPWPADRRFAEIYRPETRAPVAFAPTDSVRDIAVDLLRAGRHGHDLAVRFPDGTRDLVFLNSVRRPVWRAVPAPGARD